MTVIRHVRPDVFTPPPPINDHTTDTCNCGFVYQTINGDPDPYLYGLWLDHHEPHWETR